MEWVPLLRASQVALVVKNPPISARDEADAGSVPGSGRSRAWQLTPVFLLENPMGRGAWWAGVHRVVELDTTEAT